MPRLGIPGSLKQCQKIQTNVPKKWRELFEPKHAKSESDQVAQFLQEWRHANGNGLTWMGYRAEDISMVMAPIRHPKGSQGW